MKGRWDFRASSPGIPRRTFCQLHGPTTIAVSPLTDREEVARLLSKYNLLAVPVVAEDGHVLGIVTVDDVIDAIIAEGTEDVQKFGGMEALDEPYLKIDFADDDQEARGLAVRAVPVGDADRQRDAALPGASSRRRWCWRCSSRSS